MVNIRLTLEIDANSNALRSIVFSGAKIIEDYVDGNDTKVIATVEFAVDNCNVIHSIISSRSTILSSNDTKEAFYISIAQKEMTIYKYLVECGAVDVKERDILGKDMLHFALEEEADPDLIMTLIKAGSEVNSKDNYGRTPLIKAVIKNDEEVVRLLIEVGGAVNEKDSGGANAIMWSARYGKVQNSRILLENGADFTAKGLSGETVLSRAMKSEDEETIQLVKYASRIHRATLFIQSIEYLRNHRQEYEEEEVREYIPDHVMNGFFRNTIWK